MFTQHGNSEHERQEHKLTNGGLQKTNLHSGTSSSSTGDLQPYGTLSPPTVS